MININWSIKRETSIGKIQINFMQTQTSDFKLNIALTAKHIKWFGSWWVRGRGRRPWCPKASFYSASVLPSEHPGG